MFWFTYKIVVVNVLFEFRGLNRLSFSKARLNVFGSRNPDLCNNNKIQCLLTRANATFNLPQKCSAGAICRLARQCLCKRPYSYFTKHYKRSVPTSGCNPGLSQTTGNCQGRHTNPEQQIPPVQRRDRPMCRPAWRVSTRHREQWEQMKHPHQNFRPRKTRNQP